MPEDESAAPSLLRGAASAMYYNETFDQSVWIRYTDEGLRLDHRVLTEEGVWRTGATWYLHEEEPS